MGDWSTRHLKTNVLSFSKVAAKLGVPAHSTSTSAEVPRPTSVTGMIAA